MQGQIQKLTEAQQAKDAEMAKLRIEMADTAAVRDHEMQEIIQVMKTALEQRDEQIAQLQTNLKTTSDYSLAGLRAPQTEMKAIGRAHV